MLKIMDAKRFWEVLSLFGEIGDVSFIESIDYDEVKIEQIDTKGNWYEVSRRVGYNAWDTIYTYPDGEPTSSDQWDDDDNVRFSIMREGLILPRAIVEQIIAKYEQIIKEKEVE